MGASAIVTYGMAGVVPAYRAEEAKRVNFTLPASVTYAKGTIVGEKIGNDEIQSIKIDATGGTFTVTFGGQTTAATAYNATAAVLQANLEALSTIGANNVSVAKPRSRWTLAQQPGTDGGFYAIRVTIGGVSRTTAPLAWNANSATVDGAVEGLSNVGTGGVVAVYDGTGGVESVTLDFLPSLGDVQIDVVGDTTSDGGVFEGGIVASETNLGGVYVVTFQGSLGKANVAAMTTGAGSLTGGAGTATVATITAGSAGTPGQAVKCDPTATDGSQRPIGVLQYDCATDASGNITLGSQSGGDEFGVTQLSAPVYVDAYLRSEDIVGLTSALLAQFGRLVHGTIASGVVHIH